MKHLWKRLIASVLTAVMLVSVLPPTALAALVDNTPDQNEAILQELTAFWGDEKTAQEAMELLRKYNLIDEDGNILTDWSGTITIEEEARALAFSDAMALTGGTVTVNGRACGGAELSAILRQMEALGLLADGAPVADWQIEVTDEAETADELETPPAVKVLGQEVDPAALQEVTDFLDQYGLLTETGCLTDWDITQPGGSRPSDVTELLALLEDETADRSMAVTVDGTPITLGDFETMIKIETEIKRIQDTYLQEKVDLTPEQASNLYSLYEQLSENGIMLYNTQGADDLVFPSGVNHSATVSVSLDKPIISGASGGTVTATYTVSGAENDQVVSFDVYVLPGGAADWVQAQMQPVTITGNGSGTVSVNVGKLASAYDDTTWDGQQRFYFYATDIQNALFSNGKTTSLQAAVISNRVDAFTTKIEESTTATKELNFTDAQRYFLRNLASHCDYTVSFSVDDDIIITMGGGSTCGSKDTVFYASGNPYGLIFDYYQYLKGGAFLENTRLAGVETGYSGRIASLGLSSDNTEAGINKDFYFSACKILDSNWESPSDGKDNRYRLSLASGSTPETRLDKDLSKTNQPISSDFRGAEQITLAAEGHVDRAETKRVIGYNQPERYKAIVTQYDLGVTTKLTVKDSVKPTVTGVAFPTGMTFPTGSSVPITVTFSEPVKSAGAKLTANGKVLSAQESATTSKTLTFLFPVNQNDKDIKIEVTEIRGAADMLGQVMNADTVKRQSENILSTTTLKDAIPGTSIQSADVGKVTYHPASGDQEERTTATVRIPVALPSDTDLRNVSTLAYPNGDAYYSSLLAGSIDGGETLIPLELDNSQNPTKLTATVELDAAKLMEQQEFVMEFYTIDGTTHQSTGLFFGRYAAFSVTQPVPLLASSLSIQTPAGWPAEPVYANNPPEAAALTLQAVVNAPAGTTWTQTRWVSSDESIATIGADGQVYPLGVGTATFYLEAVNGNLTQYGEQRSQGVSLTIQQGAEPYLRIPESEMTIRSGDPATLRWASNLVQKNEEYANAPTTFTITVTGPNGQQAGQYTVTYDPNDRSAAFPGTETPMWVQATDESGAETWSPNQSFPITGLTDTDTRGYTVTISASAGAAVPGTEKDFTATAKVTVVSRPVTVRLIRPENLVQTNTGTLTVNYTLENYDSKNNASFKLVVTDNATGSKVYESTSTDPSGGSFTMDLSNAQTGGFRTIYDVSLQAKNTAEPDWSRDSFTLYIYDKNCLDILVQPIVRNGKNTVAVSGGSVTMSNEAWIASLTQDQILALNRDINLQAAISINYGAHAWGEASDRIRWASENSSIAAINYPQGSYYENIESLPYTSYAPATQFLLSGKKDGGTVVEAIHALAGDALGSSVNITVETLKNKLYLFQFYPAASGLTITYTNGNKEPKTATSDSQGRFAIYEASGIASDVYVSGTIDGDVYLGTVYNSRLVSQEKDAVSLELYPLNTLTLRKAATLPVYLLNEQGEPYTGNVTIRAGVYRNGTLCADAKYTTTAGGAADIAGDDEGDVRFQNGKATFYYDLTQFNTNNGANPVTAADSIEFVLELRAGNGTTYYPVLFTANGTANEEDTVRLAERIINLEKVPAGQANQPFVARQAVYFSGKESGPATDVRNKNGKLGPSSDYPNILLSTTVLWWGADQDKMDGNQTIQYVDSTGIALQGQAVDNVSYPFCSMPVSHSTVNVNKAQLQHLGMKDLTIRTVTLKYLDGDGTAVKQENMRWQLMNALSLAKAGESNSLLDSMAALKDIMMSDGGMGDVESDFLTVGLSLATTARIESDFLTMKLSPTQDPTVFRGLVWVGLGADSEGVHGSGGYGGNLLETMGEDEESYELNYMPGLDDVKDMISSGLAAYGQTQKNMAASAKNLLVNNVKQGGLSSVGGGDASMEFSLSGYFETEVYYDFNAGEWKMQLVTGGFQADGGFGYEWSSNFQVGPVPMFLELGVGISAAVEFNAAVNNVERLNDYLTQLQVKAYLKAFGGFGFDYAIVAFKLGIFGELSLDAQMRWLDAAKQRTQFGYKVTLAGEVGVKVEVAVLFFSYSKVLWSQGFEADLGTSRSWNSIENYWKEVGAGKSGAGGLIVPEGANLLAYDAATGTALLSADQETALVDRDYLDQYRRSYNSAGPGADDGFSFFNLFSNGTNTPIVKTIENAYSYASPAITDDGRWLFYLDDMGNRTDATVIRVSAAEKPAAADTV